MIVLYFLVIDFVLTVFIRYVLNEGKRCSFCGKLEMYPTGYISQRYKYVAYRCNNCSKIEYF